MKHIQHCFALETPCKSRPSLCPLHMKKSTVWFGFLMRWQGVFKVWLYWLAVNGSLVPSCHGSKNADGRCKNQIGCEPNMRQRLERRERTKVGIKSTTTEGLKRKKKCSACLCEFSTQNYDHLHPTFFTRVPRLYISWANIPVFFGHLSTCKVGCLVLILVVKIFAVQWRAERSLSPL